MYLDGEVEFAKLVADPRKDLPAIHKQLEALRRRHRDVVAIVSPPRCSSTAFARMFWEHPAFRYYSHEPFEVTYYDGLGMDAVLEKLRAPLDLSRCYGAQPQGEGLVIKEMPYQVGKRIDLLFSLATAPVVFLLRDPRLNIASRMHNKVVGGEPPLYPLIESGWRLLARHIDRCRQRGVDHILVDATDFRSHPQDVFTQVFDRLGFQFSRAQLRWHPCTDIELDNLDGRHRHLYRRVLQSSGIQPATESVPELSEFPEEDGLRAHVARCLELYQQLRKSPQRICPRHDSN